MLRAYFPLVCIGALSATSSAAHPPNREPLIEFTAVNDDSARSAPPIIEDCGYYLRIRGVAGHNGGSRLGASVQLRTDSLFIAITSYRTSEFVPHDWQMARWTLRIGGLESKRYHVELLTGSEPVRRDLRLSFGPASCAA